MMPPLTTVPVLALELSVPIACDPGRDCFVQNYVDIDPGKTVLTVDCGQASYDSHKGTDFRVLNTKVEKDVLAAAPGRVKALRQDMPDRLVRTKEDRAAVRDKECGNGLVIIHGDGWETQYCHMRQGTLSVSVGDEVERGQPLGKVGFSGLAAFPHVHLSVRKDGKTVDPFLGTAEKSAERVAACAATETATLPGGSLWDGEASGLLQDAGGALVETGFAGKPVKSLDLETDSKVPPASNAPALVFFARLINLKKGDRVALELVGPEGTIAVSDGKPLESNKAQWVTFAGRKTPQGGWPKGTYSGEAVLWRDGNALMRRSTRFELDN
ncbi:M23 family metallopeptidase [Roseibium sediminicola]|uniref:M23 family metallopeptidase n=1 Tax=Roseibium sediminicola TaxID=2933272 RepID=A0ABT0GZA0_9HYPH|nr:M23 family metallopeptidase [Roseibium sp. CAU 1639]MCK7614765.1 M23 family metallopeptidase [Roseibium sp. CAU 1639]